MNKVLLIGNLTKDPELTTTSTGVSVARFSIAVQRRYANEDGTRDADFLNCVAWRTIGENLFKYCKKGDKIAIWGSIQTRSYETNGVKKYATEVVADEIEFLNTKRTETNGTNNGTTNNTTHNFTPIDDDNLPF